MVPLTPPSQERYRIALARADRATAHRLAAMTGLGLRSCAVAIYYGADALLSRDARARARRGMRDLGLLPAESPTEGDAHA